MNCFEPLITHSPPSSRAVVRVAPASDPASGSVSPNPASARPASRSGSSSLLLLLGAEAEDRHRAEADAGLEGDRERLVDAAERLDREAQGEVVAALPAVLLGERQAEQPQLAHLRDDVERQRVRAVGLVGARRDDLVGEVAHHARRARARRRSGRSCPWCPRVLGRVCGVGCRGRGGVGMFCGDGDDVGEHLVAAHLVADGDVEA